MSEILIRGAGIAGQVLHRELKRSGFHSTLWDTRSFPRDKVCGGILQNDSWEYLKSLFALPEPRWIFGLSHYWRAKKISSYALEKPMAFLPRMVLDAALDSENKSEPEKGGVPKDALLILASGMPRQQGDWIGFSTEAEVQSFSSEIRMHYGRGIYLGLVPLEAGRGHAAFIVKKSFFKGPADLRERVRSELGVTLCGDLKGTSAISYDFFSQDLAVGDAKMSTHPFLGFGMKHAILSARLCAEHIRDGRIAEYPGAHARLFAKQWWASRAGGRLFDSPFQVLLKPIFQSPVLFRGAYRWVHGVRL